MTQTLALPFRRPFDWAGLCRFFAARAVPGVEVVGPASYARTFVLGGQASALSVTLPDGGDALAAEIRFPDPAWRPEIARRLRRLFDLDADPEVVNTHLARDAELALFLVNNVGIRVPGAWDGFELAVRAILGQQVSVAAARNLAGKLAGAFGTPIEGAENGLDRLFPKPDQLLDADIALVLNMPRARGAAIRTLAAAYLAERDLLEPGQGLERAVARLTALPGIGAWSAHYIAMRALKEPDAFPHGDIGLMRALDRGSGRPSPKALLARAELWRPYRAYAAMHLWASDAAAIEAARIAR